MPVFRTDRSVAGYTLYFEWHGGAYIEIGFAPETAFDVINVWNYATDEPTIARTQAAFEESVDDYINDPERDLAHDLREYALGS
jgi:hypothetical protein